MSPDNRWCTAHQAVCERDELVFYADRTVSEMRSKVRSLYSIQLHFLTYNRRLKALRKLQERKDRDRKDKDKDKGGRRKGPQKGGQPSVALKSAGRKSKVTKNNPQTRTTRSMTRMFDYYVEMKQTTINKENPDGPLLLVKSIIAGASARVSNLDMIRPPK